MSWIYKYFSPDAVSLKCFFLFIFSFSSSSRAGYRLSSALQHRLTFSHQKYFPNASICFLCPDTKAWMAANQSIRLELQKTTNVCKHMFCSVVATEGWHTIGKFMLEMDSFRGVVTETSRRSRRAAIKADDTWPGDIAKQTQINN